MKYAFFVAGFVVAALLAGVYILRKGPIQPFAGGDDEPIVVAGGSLDLASLNGWKKETPPPAGYPYTAIQKHTKRQLTIGLIVYNNGAPVVQPLPAGQMKLEIAYCNGVCSDLNNPDDKVTVWTDANGNKLRVSNTNSQHQIGDEADAATASGSTTISHQPDWKVNRIRDVVHSADYPCANFKCQIVLVYHCDNSGHCQ
jgi:hypothetical protein